MSCIICTTICMYERFTWFQIILSRGFSPSKKKFTKEIHISLVPTGKLVATPASESLSKLAPNIGDKESWRFFFPVQPNLTTTHAPSLTNQVWSQAVSLRSVVSSLPSALRATRLPWTTLTIIKANHLTSNDSLSPQTLSCSNWQRSDIYDDGWFWRAVAASKRILMRVGNKQKKINCLRGMSQLLNFSKSSNAHRQSCAERLMLKKTIMIIMGLLNFFCSI